MAQSAAEKKRRSEAAKKAAKTRKQNEQKAPQVDRQRSQPESEEPKLDEQAASNGDEQQDAPVEVEQREVKEPTSEQASQHSFQNDRENEKNLQRVAHNVRTGGGEVYENELEDQRDLHRRRTAFAA